MAHRSPTRILASVTDTRIIPEQQGDPAGYSPVRDLAACLGIMFPFMAVFTAVWVALP